MSKYQRDKGCKFEREIASILSDRIGNQVKRNLSQARGGEGADITVGKFSIECKRRARISVMDWLDQAKRDAGSNTPIVIARADGREAIAIISLDDLIPMLIGEL